VITTALYAERELCRATGIKGRQFKAVRGSVNAQAVQVVKGQVVYTESGLYEVLALLGLAKRTDAGFEFAPGLNVEELKGKCLFSILKKNRPEFPADADGWVRKEGVVCRFPRNPYRLGVSIGKELHFMEVPKVKRDLFTVGMKVPLQKKPGRACWTLVGPMPRRKGQLPPAEISKKPGTGVQPQPAAAAENS
jgi:hypothetical protein